MERKYSCGLCNASFIDGEMARSCEERGLPQIVSPGTVYGAGRNLFVVTGLVGLDGNPLQRTHDRHYSLKPFDAKGLLTDLALVTGLSYSGSTMHNIEGHFGEEGNEERVGISYVPLSRLNNGQLTELLDADEKFSEFYLGLNF